MAAIVTTGASTTNASSTVGEELYLIHLRRESAGSTAEIHKHQALLGQELWNVHCQRSRGDSLEEDKDVQDKTPLVKVAKSGNKGKSNKTSTGVTPAVRTKKPSKTVATAVTRYNLRSKDVALTKKKE
jgi:hypothetical protein